MRIVSDLADLRDATLAVEAVREELDVKREVLDSLGKTLADSAILATTTSSLAIQELATASGRPERFLGLHVFNPVERMPLVELCFPTEADDRYPRSRDRLLRRDRQDRGRGARTRQVSS